MVKDVVGETLLGEKRRRAWGKDRQNSHSVRLGELRIGVRQQTPSFADSPPRRFANVAAYLRRQRLSAHALQFKPAKNILYQYSNDSGRARGEYLPSVHLSFAHSEW